MPSILNQKRPFGATGVEVPLIGYGTAPLGKDHVSIEFAADCLNYAIDCGITYLDTAPVYGSEPKIGEVMKTRRDEVFLATKVERRSRHGTLEQLKESLDRLQTDHVDLIQVHGVNAWADWEQAVAPDGCLGALEEAREQGLTRFIGITGHTHPSILAEVLKAYDFDSVLVAIGMADHLVSAPEAFVLPVAQQKNIGVVAMKVYGHGAFESRDLALRYSLGLPGVSLAIIGLDNREHIDEVVRLANDFQPLREEEEVRLIEEVRGVMEQDRKESEKGKGILFWLRDTNVTGWVEDDEPVLVSY